MERQSNLDQRIQQLMEMKESQAQALKKILMAMEKDQLKVNSKQKK